MMSIYALLFVNLNYSLLYYSLISHKSSKMAPIHPTNVNIIISFRTNSACNGKDAKGFSCRSVGGGKYAGYCWRHIDQDTTGKAKHAKINNIESTGTYNIDISDIEFPSNVGLTNDIIKKLVATHISNELSKPDR
jgi:hypothetical protein